MRREHAADRSGFTLVEILLSLGLLMVVLAGAYSALNLFRLVTTAGRADAERSQLARAIERRITSDVRCIRFAVPEAEPASTDATQSSGGGQVLPSTGGAADDPVDVTSSSTAPSPVEPELASTDPADAYATQSMGVFGDATTLVLHVSKPAQPALSATSTPDPLALMAVPTSGGDLRSISYFLAVAGAGGLQGAVGNVAGGGTANYSLASGLQGLARLDGDRLALAQAHAAGEVDALAQNAELIAPEVTELKFRYFDGAAWLDAWDSATMKAVPRAIEVTLRIDVASDDVDKPPLKFGETPPLSSGDVFRFVIAVPLSDPTLGLVL